MNLTQNLKSCNLVEMQLIGLDVEGFMEELFKNAALDARSANILSHRFGFESSKATTLQALGAKYGITRERIRQLEAQAINEVKKSIANFEEVIALRDFAEKHLFATGGLRKDDVLMDEIHAITKSSEDKNTFGNKIRFILKTLEQPHFADENQTFYSFWYTNEKAKKNLEAIHDEVTNNLAKVEQFEEVLRQAASARDFQESVAVSLLAISKRLDIGPYGDIGLSEWEEINPKTVRAKAFLLLKKEKSFMHFTEIAKKINSHAPTVHNELIKDSRFILSGRGTYGLKSE